MSWAAFKLLMGGSRGAVAAALAAMLAVALGGLLIALSVQGAHLKALQAAADSHDEQLRAKDDRLALLRGQVSQLEDAGKAQMDAFHELKGRYDELAREAGVRAQQDAAAIARAQAAARDAERTLSAFMDRYRSSYTGGCKAAIEQLDRMCPNLVNP